MNSEYINLDELIKILFNTTKSSIYTKINRNKLPFGYTKIGKELKFSRIEVEEYIKTELEKNYVGAFGKTSTLPCKEKQIKAKNEKPKRRVKVK